MILTPWIEVLITWVFASYRRSSIGSYFFACILKMHPAVLNRNILTRYVQIKTETGRNVKQVGVRFKSALLTLLHTHTQREITLRDSLQNCITLHKARSVIFLRLVQNACRNWAIAPGVTPWGPKYAQEP